MEGTVLAGRYRLEQLLGQGGFGVVYRATQIPLGRAVAVKLMQASLGDDGARFAQEAALAQRLEHPNTVRILDFGVLPDGRPFIVWELLRGHTVAELIASSGPLSPAIVRRIAVQVLKSLMEAHAHGVIHRDIKPANVFVATHPGEPYFVKVLDFGIAKDLAQKSPVDPTGRTIAPSTPSSSAETHGGQIMGTPQYMAPEQALSLPVGPETDVYAVGLLIAEMLAGGPVFSGTSGMQVLLAQASAEPVPLPTGVTSGPLGAITQRATRKIRTERYGSAATMLAELEAVRGLDESVLTTVPPQSGQPTPSGLASGGGGQATQAAQLAHQPTLLAPVRTQADMTAPAMQLDAGAKVGSGSASRYAVAVGLLAAALATGAYVAIRHTGSPSASSPPEPEESEAEPEARASRSASRASGRKKREAPAVPPNTKWEKRTPVTFDQLALQAKLEQAGFEIKKVTEYGAGTPFLQVVTSVSKPPCAGTVFTYAYPNEATTLASKQILMKDPTLRVFVSGSRILAVVLGTMDKPEGDRACTDTLAFDLTE